MESHKKTMTLATIGGVLLLLAAWVAFDLMKDNVAPDPVYKGKTLSVWLAECVQMYWGPASSSPNVEATAAVNAMGTNVVVPTLLSWMEHAEPRSLIWRGASAWRRKSDVPMPHWLREHSERHDLILRALALRAMVGLSILNENAASAIPALKEIKVQEPGSPSAQRAEEILQMLAQQGVTDK